jgi:uncharacterized membrane protein
MAPKCEVRLDIGALVTFITRIRWQKATRLLYDPFISEIGTILLAVLATWAGYKVYGRKAALLFVGGAVLWTSLIENFGVAEGTYTYSTQAGFFLWVGLVPFWVEAGWITVVFTLFILFHEVLLKDRSPWLQAMFTGLLAVNMDLVIDPVAVANNLWRWTERSVYVLGVPIDNWLGWFLVVFFFDVLFNSTVLRGRTVFGFGRVERVVLSDSYTDAAKSARLAIRLVVTILIVAIVLSLVQMALASLPGSS